LRSDGKKLKYLMSQLNDKQQEAVNYSGGNAFVIAGAGAGKTRTIIERINKLLKDGVSPKEILCVTFSNGGAKEIRSRLTDPRVLVHTFHGWGLMLLKRFINETNIEPYGRRKGFTIVDAAGQRAVFAAIAGRQDFLNIGTWKLDEDFSPKTACDEYQRLKDNTMAKKVRPEGAFNEERERYLFDNYEAIIAERNQFDYADLIRIPTWMLNDKEQFGIGLRYKYIIVDEFQDTNSNQYDMLKAIASACEDPTMFGVGDVDQAIYEWRSARPENVNKFIDEFDAKKINLELNYRSTENIVEGANAVIEHNKRRIKKTMKSACQIAGDKITVVHMDEERDQAEAIAKLAIEQARTGDVAILYRNNSMSGKIEKELIRRGEHYKLYKDTSFFNRLENKLTMMVLKCVVNKHDVEALTHALSSSVEKLGAGGAEKIAMMSMREYPDWNEVRRVNKTAKQKAVEMIAEIEAMRGMGTKAVAAELEKWSWQARLCAGRKNDNEEKSMERAENVGEIINMLASEDVTVDEFVNEKLIDMSGENAHETEEPNIKLMTFHASKGGEFDSVIISHAVEAFLPGMIIPGDAELEESRRLFYVGMTRAKKRLSMFTYEESFMWNREILTEESRFVKEIPGIHKEEKRVWQL